MKTVKVKLFSLLATLMVVFAVIVLYSTKLVAVSAVDEVTGTIYMVDGASVSFDDGKGDIRFSTVVDAEMYGEYGDSAVYGTLVYPSTESDVTLENYTEKNALIAYLTPSRRSDGSATFSTEISYDDVVDLVKKIQGVPQNDSTNDEEMLKKAYAMQLTAVSFANTGDGIEYAQSTTRSARSVAIAAVLNGEKQDEQQDLDRLKEYIGGELNDANATEDNVYDLSSQSAQTVKIANLPSGEVQEVLIGAKAITGASVSGTSVTIPSGVLTPSGEGHVSVIAADGNVYSDNLIVATKVIKTANDLAMFNPIESGTTNDDISTTSGLEFDGYYVLGNNINATQYVHPKTSGYLTGINIVQFENNLTKKFGLTGTFNGMGYSINGLTTTEHGIFAVINGGTVKNVAINVIKRASEFTTNPALAQFVVNANIENVYVGGEGVQNGAVFGDMANSTVTSCVFEFDGMTSSGKAVYGSLSRTSNDKFQTSSFSDVYVISPKVLTHWNSGTDYEVDAQNRSDSFITADNTTNTWENASQYNVDGIIRYDTRSAMKKETLNYANLSSKYWDVSSGTPVFKNINLRLGEETVIDMFSAYDGNIDLVKAFSANSGDEITLTTATQDGNALEVDGNLIKGVLPAYQYNGLRLVDVDYVLVTLDGTVNGEPKTVTVALKAYTRVIDDESDMLMFVDNVAEKASDGYYPINGVPFSGYYILSRDLEMTPEDTNNNFLGAQCAITMNGRNTAPMLRMTAGLTGVFDGNGYTIDKLSSPTNGLFGTICNGTVKNVAFTNVNVNFGSTLATNRYCIAAQIKNAVIDNVYIQTDKISSSEYGSATVAILDAYDSTLSNVLIDIPTKYTTANTNGYGSLFARMYDYYVSNPNKGEVSMSFNNVYVISPNALVTHTKSGDEYVIDAENVTGDGITASLIGVKRYATAAEVSESDVSFGYWTISADGSISWVKPVA